MTESSTWYRIRKEMFEHLVAEVRDKLGPDSPELKSYRESYEADLARRWKVSTRDELIQALSAAQVCLFGDFHALQQSQKTHRRLLESIQAQSNGPVVLAVECIPQSAQKALDLFQAGKLSEKDFLKRARWSQWGFPWAHYQPLFKWARQNKTPVYALDRRGPRLKVRDREAATKAKEIRRAHPQSKLIVIMGDLHLASDRLPRELRRVLGEEVRMVRVFQNSESASLRLLKKKLDHKVDVIRFDRNTFSVQNVPPWVKWQNYSLWLEQQVDSEIDDDAPDMTDPVASMVRWIAHELDVKVDPGELTVHTAADEDLWSRLKEQTAPSARPWLEAMIEDGRSFYLSSGGWGYLSRASVNHASTLAMQFIHDRLSGGAPLNFNMPADFQKMIWIETVAFFGSKIVNPKRKSDTLADIRSSLSSRQGDDGGREALRLALSQKMTEMMALSGEKMKATDFRPRKKSSWIAASNLLGAILGERMYHGYRKGLLSRDTVRALLRKPMKHAEFSLMYREMLEIIEALPAPFRSKKEKL